MKSKGTNKEPAVKIIGVGPAGRNIIASVSRTVKAAMSKVSIIHHDGIKCSGEEEFYSEVELIEADSKSEMLRLSGDIKNSVVRIDMVIITGCLGCETLTGGVPKLTHVSRKAGVLTIAVVAKASFKDSSEERKTEKNIVRLKKNVDAFIVISDELSASPPNKSDEPIELSQRASETVSNIVRRLAFLAVEAGCPPMGVDRLKGHLTNAGRIYIGIGKAKGNGRAKKAAYRAIKQLASNGGNIKDAQIILLQIEGGGGIRMDEFQSVVSIIKRESHPNAKLQDAWLRNYYDPHEIGVTMYATTCEQ